MNNNQIRYEFKDGTLYARFNFRDWDDPDDDGTPIIEASTPAESLDDYRANKTVKGLLANAYDRYIKSRY